jgi:hypothetical protein
MFSASDIKELLRAFPPTSPQPLSFEQSQPFLIPNATGNGFIVSSSLSHDFGRLVEDSSGRIGIASLSSRLNVSEDVVLQLSQRSSGDVVMSKDQGFVCSRKETQVLMEKLAARAANELAPEASFAQELDITIGSVRKLMRLHNQTISNEEEPEFLSIHTDQETATARTFIFTKSYRSSVENALLDSFKQADSEAKYVFHM